MRKIPYLESKVGGAYGVCSGVDVTARLPAAVRAMGPWIADGDRKHGYHITHAPSGLYASRAGTMRDAIAALASRDLDNVRRAVDSAPVIPAEVRARILATESDAAQ